MRKDRILVFGIVFICSALRSECQTPAFSYKPYGGAVVVSNIQKSVSWYQSVLGLATKTKMDDPNGAYHIVILESPEMTLELLELKGSVKRKDALVGKPANTEIDGHFKIFLHVADMDSCLAHMKKINVNVPQVWTDATTKKRNFLVNDPDGNLVQFFE